jgi:hypothetical protein
MTVQTSDNQRTAEAGSISPIQSARLPTPAAALVNIWQSAIGDIPNHYAESDLPGMRIRSIDVPDSRGEVRGHATEDQRTREAYPSDAAGYLTEISSRPRRKRLDDGIKNDIETRDGRIGYRRF